MAHEITQLDFTVSVASANVIHEDEPFTKSVSAAVDREIKSLAEWLELDLALPR